MAGLVNKPLEASKSHLATVDPKPWWQRRSLWVSVIATIVALPDLWHALTPFVPVRYAPAFGLAGIIIGWIAVQLARQGGVQAAANVKTQDSGGR
jgi:hypothetical protein